MIGKETGLGWNHRLRTIDASEEWWEKKIKENPQFSRFRKNGIDPELEKKLNLMFMNTVATGEHVWVPSSGDVGIAMAARLVPSEVLSA